MDFLRNRQKKQHYAIWIKDFKPKSLSDIVGNQDLIKSLQIYINTGKLPNILLTGPNGSGKRNIAELCASEYLGQYYKDGCIRIDGAISRGKDVVTNTNYYKKQSSERNNGEHSNIMNFAKQKLNIGDKKKIIIIYNFDNMTNEAQNAMRRIIEKYAKKTRFILVCNNIENVIEAIQSRCVPLKTSGVDDYEMINMMRDIMKQADLNPDILCDKIYEVICMLSEGDMKRAINYLQVISSCPTPTIDAFFEIFNIPPVHKIISIMESIKSHETYQQAYDDINELLLNGYNATDILEIFVNTVIRYPELSLELKTQYLHALSKCYVKTEFSKSDTQLLKLIANLGNIYKNGYQKELI